MQNAYSKFSPIFPALGSIKSIFFVNLFLLVFTLKFYILGRMIKLTVIVERNSIQKGMNISVLPYLSFSIKRGELKIQTSFK